MRNIIVVSERGIIDGIFSDDPNDLDVDVIEDTDMHNEDYIQKYWRNQWLLEQGCYTDVMYRRIISRDAFAKLSAVNPSIAEKICLSSGDKMNEKKIAFIDGFLAAWGSLNKYRVALMYSEKQEERERGEMLNRCLSELTDEWKKTYDALYDQLWKSEVENEDNPQN